MASRLTAAFKGPAKRKLICRSVMLVLSFVTVGLLAAICAIGPTLGSWDDDSDPLFAAMALMAPAWSFIYSAISFFLHVTRTSYHPGWDVGFDLISWLMQLIWAFILFPVFLGPETKGDCLNNDNYHVGFCDYAGLRDQVRCELSACIFLLINGLFIFAYFVRACRRTELLRRQRWMDRGQRVSVELGEAGAKHPKEPEQWEVPPITGHPPSYAP